MKLLRILLFPFAVLYDIITSIRNYFFDTGVLKSTKFKIPVLAVGNLSVGGTGKSPQIEYLIRLLKNDYKIAVLSRGYKRKTKGFQLINENHATEDVGDEPMQFYRKFKEEVYIAVDSDRTNGIQQLLQLDSPPELILLDDAYQHRKVTASTYILLTKFDDLFINDFILPTGTLRESRRGVNRARAIVVTKCPEKLSVLEQDELVRRINPSPNQEVFFSTIVYDEQLGGIDQLKLEDLTEAEIVLVTGIANPSSLLNYLNEREVKFHHIKFPDHHHFSEADLKRIQQQFNNIQHPQKYIVTTEKDFVRLEGKLNSLAYIGIKNTFLGDEKGFDSLVLDEIRKEIF
ncbi:tetraacyldisaccharide 4'-kinase [uncultured Tenacibaculum sp.]|uniref:tetraacyldisaccharide 4'-kinase n=1 Tax=uncultured Tenacibaculum sp. TaxID=174713 RepID=UPI0026104EAB|nr:tetraacyldisaccharide 4'-kinase [uncultured Tenacibaculum sp.]